MRLGERQPSEEKRKVILFTALAVSVGALLVSSGNIIFWMAGTL